MKSIVLVIIGLVLFQSSICYPQFDDLFSDLDDPLDDLFSDIDDPVIDEVIDELIETDETAPISISEPEPEEVSNSV